jgi:hypothetical protein
VVFNVSAQDEMETGKKETFDKNAFRWQEIAEKKKSAIIQDGYLVMTSKKKGDPIICTTRFPMDVTQNFKVTAKIFVPEFKKSMGVGVIFNYINDDGFIFLIGGTGGYALTTDGGTKSGITVIKDGKNLEFIFVVEKRGGKLTFSVNNMEICDVKTELESPVWGFIALNNKGSSLIKVDEVTIEQNLENE